MGADAEPSAQEEQETNRAFVRRALLILTASPASIGILGQINERWELGSLLERIIRGYSAVSGAVWQAIFDVIPFHIPFNHLYLTLVFLTFVPAAAYIVFQARSGVVTRKAPTMSVILGIWGLTAAVYFLVPVLVPAVIFCVFAGLILEALSMGDWTRRELIRNSLLGLSGLMYYLIVPPTADFGSRWDFVLFGLAACILSLIPFLSIHIALRMGYQGLNYMVLIVSGVVATDWIARGVRPAVDAWLTSIGA